MAAGAALGGLGLNPLLAARSTRRKARRVATLLGGLCAATALGAPMAAATASASCSNFAQVTPGLYRGAEPDERCLAHLAELGIKMVVNLRDESDDSGQEQGQTIALGMRYVNVPLSGFGRPSMEQVQRILAELRATENQPAFLHCKHGSDRTGVIVAAYRMTYEGWTSERALKEAKDFGMGWWQYRMKGFIRDFAQWQPSPDTTAISP